MRNLLIASLAVGLVVAATHLSACGGETGNLTPDTGAPAGADAGNSATACTGVCDCGAGVDCACSGTAICTQNCAGATCDVACSNVAKCTVAAGDGLNLSCSNTSECTGSGAKNGEIACSNLAKCSALKVTDNAQVACSNNASCEVEVGAGSQINCQDEATCAIKCVGACTFVCGGLSAAKPMCSCSGTGCASGFTCTSSGGLITPTTCPDGRMVCNQTC
jgi:hypothetical protein